MNILTGLSLASAACALISTQALAQAVASTTPAADKSGYTVFNPTPDSLMRPLETDRPGKSYSPFTVDAGHVQVESDLWLYSFDHWSPNATTTRSTTILDPNLKIGLTDWLEFDATLPLHTAIVTRSRIGQDRRSGQGLGDLNLGGKINFVGNNGDGSRGIGLLFYAELPSGASGVRDSLADYLVTVPVVLPLPGQFSLTIEPAIALMDNAIKDGYHGDAQLILNVNHQIPGTPVIAALELALDAEADRNTGDQNTIDGSLQWPIGKDFQLDGGVYIGLNKSAPDWSPYVGFSARF